MKQFFLKLLSACPFFWASCGPIAILAPPVSDTPNLAGTRPLQSGTLQKMEGVYVLAGGSKGLGKRFVCKVTGSRVAFFSEKDGIYFILQHGQQQSSGKTMYSGFWRYTKKKKQGKIELTGKNNSPALEGKFDGKRISLAFERPFTEAAVNKKFILLGHRGVQTESYPPYAENSLNALKHVEEYGVNGMEMDIRLTADNIPICVHDAIINLRTVQKTNLSGKWDSHTFDSIRSNVKLRDGQRVPSLEEALETFVSATTLTYLWLDIKEGKDIFKYIEPLVRKAYAKAASKNRHVVIIAGIPSGEIVDELHARPGYKGLPTLFEQGVDLAIENGGSFYGPRYTEGLHLAEGEKAHSNGIKMVCWTINKERVIKQYLREGNFDGFLTDNPAFVVYNLYTMF
ncbi:glycerophosphodiester phosphodiesterase [Sediminibacterium roseum]|uniref:Glycerophosphodiester phosphodiesterase n=1 Tax=Sediminibacterium roseum TaxID=1978412 RepID=A0ABW9ZY39_9BACT|nr:glycerophosphodiester phosphodiesterase [Sediminibacterium roseum]NCI50953.1 glycerophosphodiester phosphodiesterase [Sediminibacterium roseum]